MKFIVAAKHLGLEENDFLKSFSPNTNTPLVPLNFSGFFPWLIGTVTEATTGTATDFITVSFDISVKQNSVKLDLKNQQYFIKLSNSKYLKVRAKDAYNTRYIYIYIYKFNPQ